MEKLGIERLEFIGAGKHGEVYKIDEKRCIKIYRKRRYLRLELAALQRGAEAEFFPKVRLGPGLYCPGVRTGHSAQ